MNYIVVNSKFKNILSIRRRLLPILFLLATLPLCGCSKSAADADSRSSQIVHVRVGTRDLYIPTAYLRFPGSGVDNKSALIHVLYPGAAPIPGDERDLWRKGRSEEFIMVLFADLRSYEKYDLNAMLGWRLNFYKATKVVGQQYGLIYQTQPDSVKNDFDELWLYKPDDQLAAIISCKKKYASGVIPHRQELLHDDEFAYTINFDKRKLPNWKVITDNVKELIGSFHSEETARNYVSKQSVNSIQTPEIR